MITYTVDNFTELFGKLERSLYNKWTKWYDNVLLVVKKPKLELVERTRINQLIDFYDENVIDMSLEYIDEQAEEVYRQIANKCGTEIPNGLTYIGEKRLFAISVVNRPNKLFMGFFIGELGTSRFPIMLLILHRVVERLSALLGNKPGSFFIYIAKLRKTSVNCKNGATVDAYRAYLGEIARDKRERVRIEKEKRRMTF